MTLSNKIVGRWKGKRDRKILEIVSKNNGVLSHLKWVNFLKYIGKFGKEKNNDMNANLALLEYGNNKCYASIFRYI